LAETTELLTKISPPAFTTGSNFSRDGAFMAMSSEGKLKMGEPTGLVDSTTWQLAVPPRISGP
jgi:hypothetical protein